MFIFWGVYISWSERKWGFLRRTKAVIAKMFSVIEPKKKGQRSCWVESLKKRETYPPWRMLGNEEEFVKTRIFLLCVKFTAFFNKETDQKVENVTYLEDPGRIAIGLMVQPYWMVTNSCGKNLMTWQMERWRCWFGDDEKPGFLEGRTVILSTYMIL